jgi:hypothetical protein
MYVVFDADSTMKQATYKRYHDAKRLADKLNEKQSARVRAGLQHEKWSNEYVAYHIDFYREYVLYWERKRNILAAPGEGYFWELSNTPYYMSPSSETYHSS